LKLAAAASSYRVTIDRRVYVWDTGSAQLLQQWDARSAWRVAFLSDGGTLAALGSEPAVQLWNTETTRLAASLPTTGTWPTHIAIQPDSPHVAVADCRGRVHLWSADDHVNATIFELPATSDACSFTSLAISPDGALIAVGGQDHRIRLIDVNRGEVLQHLDAQDDVIRSLAFSPDHRLLATGSDDATIVVWDIPQAKPLFLLRGHGQGILSLSFSPDGQLLASGSWDGQVKLWEVATGREKLTLLDQEAPVVALAYSQDGKYLAVASTAGQVRIFLTRLEDLIALARERVTRTLTTEECQKYLRLEACPAR
jgi:WD40 repeat protein